MASSDAFLVESIYLPVLFSQFMNPPLRLSPLLTCVTFDPNRKEEVKEVETEKEAAMEAELRAARERAIVPLEARMTQFKDMLLERGVTCPHS